MTFDAQYWGETWSPGLAPTKGETVAAQYTEDCERWDAATGSTVAGKTGIAAFADAFLGALPDAVVEILSVTREDDRVVVQWVWRGTHSGDMPDWPATGGRLELPGCNVIELSGGLIRREASYWDKETLFRA